MSASSATLPDCKHNTRYRGNCVVIAGEELFAADIPEEVLAQARAAHPEALRRFAGDPGLLRSQGNLLHGRGRYAEAAEAYRAALARRPEHRSLLQNLSDSLRRAGRADEAVAAARQAIEAAP